MKIFDELLGAHAIEVWIAGMFWALLGIIAVKLYYAPSKGFNIKYWLNDNLIDVLKGFLWALVILRLGDYVLKLIATKLDFTIPETTDFVIVMIVISGFIQYKLHKKRKPISKKIETKMKVHNNNYKR